MISQKDCYEYLLLTHFKTTIVLFIKTRTSKAQIGLVIARFLIYNSYLDALNYSNQVISMEYITLYVGTYTKKEPHVSGKGQGIYQLRFNTSTGAIQSAKLAAQVANPTYLTSSPHNQMLYAIGELNEDAGNSGKVHAFTINQDGTLALIQSLDSAGYYPCYIAISPDGQHAAVPNYLSSMASLYKVKADGQLEILHTVTLQGGGPHVEQDCAHPHAMVFSKNGRTIYIPDKGSDRVWVFNAETNALVAADTPYIATAAGAGPRHMVLHPNRPYAYITNELSNTVGSFEVNPDDGSLKLISITGTLPADYQQNSVASEIRMHPTGQWLYAANRGHDSLAHFSIHADSGRLTFMGATPTSGQTPRGFILSPDGRYLIVGNQDTDNIVVFQIDKNTGSLKHLTAIGEVPTPVCFAWGGPC